MTTGNERQIRTAHRWPGWETNVIAFALVYWELDRGGPVARRHSPRHELRKTDSRPRPALPADRHLAAAIRPYPTPHHPVTQPTFALEFNECGNFLGELAPVCAVGPAGQRYLSGPAG
jgi:hypothetical protein